MFRFYRPNPSMTRFFPCQFRARLLFFPIRIREIRVICKSCHRVVTYIASPRYSSIRFLFYLSLSPLLSLSLPRYNRRSLSNNDRSSRKVGERWRSLPWYSRISDLPHSTAAVRSRQRSPGFHFLISLLLALQPYRHKSQRRLSLCIDSARYSSTAMIRPDLARANLVGDDLSHSVRDPPEFAHRRSSQRIQQIGHRSDQSSMRLCWRSSKSEFMGVSLLTFVCVVSLLLGECVIFVSVWMCFLCLSLGVFVHEKGAVYFIFVVVVLVVLSMHFDPWC